MSDEWDRKPREGSSLFLRLKTKGEMAKVRIVAAPYRQVKVFPTAPGSRPLDEAQVAQFSPGQWISIMRSPDHEIREAYILLVIDRQDGAAKIFEVSGSVYGKIRDYAKNPEWGSPNQYDITVTRTEAPGKAYWDVTPSPNKGPILTSEEDKVRAIDVGKNLPYALPANIEQPDDIDPNIRPEPLPWEQPAPIHSAAPAVAQPATPAPAAPEPAPYVDPGPKPDDKLDEVIEDIGDEPINLDDIPFN